MNDLASRLRAEAQTIPTTAESGLAERIRARLPLAMPPARPTRRLPIMLAAAALLMATITAVVMVTTSGADRAPVQPQVAMPHPPTLDEMLGEAQAGLPQASVASELDALGADLLAVARTVRGAVPF